MRRRGARARRRKLAAAWLGRRLGRAAWRSPALRSRRCRPANCGFHVAWSEVFRARFEGHPLKRIALSFGDAQRARRSDRSRATALKAAPSTRCRRSCGMPSRNQAKRCPAHRSCGPIIRYATLRRGWPRRAASNRWRHFCARPRICRPSPSACCRKRRLRRRNRCPPCRRRHWRVSSKPFRSA